MHLNLENICADIKAICLETTGTPTQKLLAILKFAGVTETKEFAQITGLSERAVQKALEGLSAQPRPWFKLHNSVVNDHAVQQLAPDVFKSWINLQCVIAQYPTSRISDADVAWRLRLTKDEWLAHKSVLEAADLITADNRSIYEPLDSATDRLPPVEWAEVRDRIFERDEYTCRYCGEKGGRLECDHVMPISRGGDNSDDNLVTSCRTCNRSKRDRIISIEEFSAKRRAAR